MTSFVSHDDQELCGLDVDQAVTAMTCWCCFPISVIMIMYVQKMILYIECCHITRIWLCLLVIAVQYVLAFEADSSGCQWQDLTFVFATAYLLP